MTTSVFDVLTSRSDVAAYRMDALRSGVVSSVSDVAPPRHGVLTQGVGVVTLGSCIESCGVGVTISCGAGVVFCGVGIGLGMKCDYSGIPFVDLFAHEQIPVAILFKSGEGMV